MNVSKALGLGIVVLLGLATLDVAGPSPFGASADAATNCPPNTPANKCRAAARPPVAGNANQPKSGGAPAGTAASPGKGSPRKAAEEDARQKRQVEEETNRQKKQAAEEAARQKKQAAKNSAKQQSGGTPSAPTSTKANAGTSGTPPAGPGSGSAKSTSGPGTSSGTTCGGGATLVGGRCTCPAGAHSLTGSGGLECVGDDGRPLTGPGPVAAPSPRPSPCSGGATLVNNTCTCPAGTRSLGGSPLRCVPVCGTGQQLSPDRTSCIAAVLNCTGGMVADKGACRCPPGTSPGPGGQQCFTPCPAGQAQALDGSGKCVAVDQNGNQIKGVTCQGGSTLVNNTCTCPAGTRALGGPERRCVPVCGTGQQLSPDGTSCVAAVLNCTGGMVADKGACRCPPGTSPGPGGQCVTQCPAGQAQALDGSGKCVAVDANGNQIKGVTCEGGSTLVNNTCTCPAGTHRYLGGGASLRCLPN